MKEKNYHTLTVLFCLTFLAVFLTLAGYLHDSTNVFKQSQEKIVQAHISHIESVDSMFRDMKNVLVNNDSVSLESKQLLLSQIHADSALFRREILLSQEEMNNAVTLHIDKIENDYAQIGIWGGILSIVFLFFGFFAIFKVEETKTEAKNVLNNIEEEGKKSKDQIDELHRQATELSDIFSAMRQPIDSFLGDSKNEFDRLCNRINDSLSQTDEKLSRSESLLSKLESKKRQYNWSIGRMESLMTQLSELIDRLKESMNNKTDENDG